MLSERTIDAARSASTSQIVGKYVQLRKKGANYLGSCPFHNEKTASFTVSEAKGIFKCFGCGESGDAISFVMKKDKLGFLEAVELVCTIAGIPIEYDESINREQYEKVKSEKETLKAVVSYTVAAYKKQLWNLPYDHKLMRYLEDRGWNRDVIAKWNIGWATDEWHFITPQLLDKNWYQEAVTLGITKRTQDNERNYDVYHGRLIFPITNRYGEPISMGGRILPWNDDGKAPKYINGPESLLYNKSQELFGLSMAIRSIEQEGFAYLVEGYADVISMHEGRNDNTVASCGTSLTAEQAKLLKKYTSHVVIMRDGDAAGQKASVRDLEVLLPIGFKVEVVVLPKNEDPDSYIKLIRSGKWNVNDIEKKDALLWRIDQIVADVFDDTYKLSKAQEEVLRLLLMISNELIRSGYFDAIIKKYRWKKTDLQKKLNELIEERASVDEDDGANHLEKMPKWMNKEEFAIKGFCRVDNKKRTGYYSYGSSGFIEITNFIINPIFHIYASRESEYLIEVNNGRIKSVLEVEAKAMVNIDSLQNYLACEGAFVIYGNKAQFLRIATYLLTNFPRCEKIQFLGWQSTGFFAFVDNIYVPGEVLKSIDEWGIYNHKGENYLIPPASAAYKHLQAKGADPYETDRALSYRHSHFSFEQWANQVKAVYQEKGIVAVAYSILTAFRDIVFNVDNNCPHLYGYGERSSGKSKWAESITALFFRKRSAFNLNSGTDFAFFRYMQAFINCPAHLNEFDDKVLKPEWFQSIKGAFDGEGRQKGVMGSKNKVEVMKIQSTLVLTGQFICTMDDNSIVSRSIIESFSEREFTEEEKQTYNRLKEMEEAGLSNILTDVLSLRSLFKEKYRETFNEHLSNWRKSERISDVINQRILQNWCHLFTCYQMAAGVLKVPTDVAVFEEYCKDNANKWSAFIRSSDTLSEFWNTFAFLVDQGIIHEGFDYKIQQVLKVRLRKDREDEYELLFNEPTKVIFIRLNNIHKHYQQAYRSRTGKEAMTMENLVHYMSSRKYYLGPNRASKFKRFRRVTEMKNMPTMAGMPEAKVAASEMKEEEITSSSYVCLFDPLNLDVERVFPEDDEPLALLGPAGWKPVEVD